MNINLSIPLPSLFIAAFLLLAITACSTDLNVEGTVFACHSDDDCSSGYSCLPLPDGRQACQLPGAGVDPDAGDDADQGVDANTDTGTDADTDTDTDADADADIPTTCEIDAEETCSCSGLPIEVDGLRTCGEDEEWGPCICPEVCEEAATGFVAQGSSCGLCDAGTYSCENGQALCSVPASANACGGCEPHPLPTACSGGQYLKCESDQSTTCASFMDSTLYLESMGIRSDLQLLYGFFAYDDETQGCQNWEAAVAADPPPVYRIATGHDSAEESYNVQLPSTIEDAGVLRIIIRQTMEVAGEPQMVSTHFGCASVTDPGQDITIDPYLHPNLLRGDYTIDFEAIVTWSTPSADDTFWTHLVADWTYPMMYTFASSPGSVFTGCSGDQCPHGDVLSLMAQYHDIRSRNDVPLLSFWNDFYSTYTDFLGDLSDSDHLRQAYDELFAAHLPAYQEVDSYRYGHIRNNFDGDGNFVPLSMHHPEGFATLSYPLATPGQESPGAYTVTGMKVHKEPFGVECIRTGNDPPYCYPAPDYVFSDNVPSMEPAISIDDDLDQVNVESLIIFPPVNQMLRHLFYDYLPAQIFPRIVETIVGVDEVEYSLETWEDFGELYRALAPCDEVIAKLIDYGEDQALAQSYASICDDLYGDADGISVLRRMSEVIPLTTEISSVHFELSTQGECLPEFDVDPYHGLRLQSLSRPSFQRCNVSGVTGEYLPPMGMGALLLLTDFRLEGFTGQHQ